MVIYIIHHLIHSVTKCACHVLSLLLRWQTLELLKHAVIYNILIKYVLYLYNKTTTCYSLLYQVVVV